MQFVGRNFHSVIDQLCAVIPKDALQLRARLYTINQDAAFRPPEGQFQSWKDLRDVLTEEIGPPKLDWQIEVGRIVRDEV